MSLEAKFLWFLAVLSIVIAITLIGSAIKESSDIRAAAEGRYCLIANGEPVYMQCIDRSAR